MTVTASQFSDFIREVYDYSPFPWQTMLVERIAHRLESDIEPDDQLWPRGIDLPTASGKTTCLDIAVYTLALSVENGADVISPRRIFFVVDRRIVVDEAHERAWKLANTLSAAKGGIVEKVADRLRELAGSDRPLVACRMRGGVRREDEWIDNPAQPAVITSTVDQLGSRLLFRGYGPGKLTQSIHAGLIGCDSLILLDEAHCAVPFMETAVAVRRYSGEGWVEQQISRPLEFAVLSATLPEEAQKDCFPAESEKEAAFEDDVLRRRIETPKTAELAIAKKPGKRDWSLGKAVSDDPLVQDAAQRAANLAGSGSFQRIAVMVNRVATAAQIHQQLKAVTTGNDGPLEVNLVLLTGRMRPIDRDVLVKQWECFLRANNPDQPEHPIILITTQCLEVGADFSFDALITECASLDALRQRFGRLDRLGTLNGAVAAAVLIRKMDEKLAKKPQDEDPVYGNALPRTWKWLNDHADNGRFDFRSQHFEGHSDDALLPANPDRRHEILQPLLAPAPHAPVLLPAHLDFLCQTAPRPEPDPDVSLFLHGPNRGVPEAQVVFRADLSDGADEREWVDAVSLLPPLSAEALSVPLPKLRRWLADQWTAPDDPTGDVETQSSDDEAENLWSRRKFVLWRGRKNSNVKRNPYEIRANDTIVVSASDKQWIQKLGHHFTRPSEDDPLDVVERVYPEARQYAVLRVNNTILEQWRDVEPVARLLEWAKNEDRDVAERNDLLQALADYHIGENEPELPEWLRRAAQRCIYGPRPTEHPASGLLLQQRRRKPEWDEYSDDTASSLDHTVSLSNHTDQVVRAIEDFNHPNRCLVPPFMTDLLIYAARLHDLGKADDRFQAYLNGGYPLGFGEESLAKGTRLRTTPSQRNRARSISELPDNFRHEMLSLHLAEASGQLPQDPDQRELVLHLIASHHGHARPFAPVCPDENPSAIQVSLNGTEIGPVKAELTENERKDAVPSHRLDSGVPERFWRLTRRYGWWGLAFLEAVLRLADWQASSQESDGGQGAKQASQFQEANT